jgi:TldD protein
MAAIVDGTFGAPLEYDRAVGYEANAGGTSYLAPPRKILGTTAASSAVTITADRTMREGASTVGWDDEGIAPQPFPLIKDGVVANYATSREFVGELTAWYRQQKIAPRSMGCAVAESGMTVPLVGTPNVILQPNAADTSIDALLSGIKNGFAVFGGNVDMDFQGWSGQGTGAYIYKVQHGKLGPPVTNATFTFQSAELWKHLIALGGVSTAMRRGLIRSKGQPNQVSMHSVQAVAARFKDVLIVSDRV